MHHFYVEYHNHKLQVTRFKKQAIPDLPDTKHFSESLILQPKTYILPNNSALSCRIYCTETFLADP